MLQEMHLMRLASRINAVPALRWDFQYQKMPDEVHVEVDSDWAQCPRTRREVVWCSGASTCSTATVSNSTRHRSAALRSTCTMS